MANLDSPSGPPSRDEFAQLLKEAIEKAGEKHPIQYDPEEYCLRTEENGGHTLNLINAYNEYCRASETNKSSVVRNFVRTYFTIGKEKPEDFESAKPDVLPVIRNRMMYEIMTMRMKTEGKTSFNWPYFPLAEYLGVGLVYDLPSSMVQIQQSTLDEWEVSFDDAYQAGCENLQAITKHMLYQEAAGVWSSPWNDNYDPSRMLLIDYIRHHKVEGDPVVMVPNRDTLLMTGTEDAAGLTRMVELAEAAYDHPRSLSAIAFRLTEENEWVPFLPSAQHPQYNQYRLLQAKSFGNDYAEQKSAMDALHEQTGKDIFVASYMAVEKEDPKEIRSYCVWSDGVVAFLPKADYIYFYRQTGEEKGKVMATVRWADAEAALGDLIKPVGIYPERYLVEEFPGDEQLAAFGFQ